MGILFRVQEHGKVQKGGTGMRNGMGNGDEERGRGTGTVCK